MGEAKLRIEYLDKATSKKEIEFGESQKALVQYSQTLDEVDTWLTKAEAQTISSPTSSVKDLSLPDIMAICVESCSNEGQLNNLSQLNDNELVCAQDVFQSSIEKLRAQKCRQEEITNWISTKTNLVSCDFSN